MEPIRITTLEPAKREIPIVVGEGDQATTLLVKLQRPGRAGVSRIASRMALAVRGDYGTGLVQSMDGRGVEMDAVLCEYVVSLPDELAVMIDDVGGDKKVQAMSQDGRPILDVEKIPPALYAAIGEAAVAWHATFRDVDVRFSAGGSSKA